MSTYSIEWQAEFKLSQNCNLAIGFWQSFWVTKYLLCISFSTASAPKEMIPLSGGFPNPAMFPFVKTVIETIDGKVFFNILQTTSYIIIYIDFLTT